LGRLLGDLRQPSKSAIHAVLDRHGLVIFAAEIWLASYSPEHPRLFGSSEIGELDRLFAADLRAQALTPMINVPRAFFQSRTSRQPIYHIALEEKQDWAYAGEPLVPLKGYPGVFWKRSKKKPGVQEAGVF